MLRAEQVALEQAAYQQLLQIREKELNYFVNNYTSIGTQAALLAGFIVSALVELSSVPHGWLTVIFHVSVSVGLMAGVHCVLATTFATVWGPGLALRGSKGSMVRAVNGMVEEQHAIFTSFGVCMLAFTAMGITTSWLVMQVEAAVIATVVFVIGLYMCYEHCKRIYRRFKIPKNAQPSDWDSRQHSTASAGTGVLAAGTHGPAHDHYVQAPDDVESVQGKTGRWKLFGRNKHSELDDNASDVSYTSTVNEKPVFMEGYLTKKGLDRTITTWNRRYFVLQGQYLYYYKSRDDYVNKQRAIKSRPIDLAGYEVVTGADASQKGGPLGFSLRPVEEEDQRRVWDFQCDTVEEFNQWTKTLRAAIPISDDD